MGISSTGVAAAGLGARKRVLIVDDQRTFADLLELALSVSADLDCEGVASGPEEAIALVRRRPPDLVIMDLHFATSTLDGIDATAEIKRASPSTQVVVARVSPFPLSSEPCRIGLVNSRYQSQNSSHTKR